MSRGVDSVLLRVLPLAVIMVSSVASEPDLLRKSAPLLQASPLEREFAGHGMDAWEPAAPSQRFFGGGQTVHAAVAAARARLRPRNPHKPDVEATQLSVVPKLPPTPIDRHRVPSFQDRRGWPWMHPSCVSSHVLLEHLARRTATMGQDGGEFEAHAMGMLFNSQVRLWWEHEAPQMRSKTVGPSSATADTTARPQQQLVYVHDRWALFTPASRALRHVDGPAGDSLYAALLLGYFGRVFPREDIAECRKRLAESMLVDSNRDQFALLALTDTQQHLKGHMASQPEGVAGLRQAVDAFKPPPPPTFAWDGELWPHPACAAPYDLLASLIRPIRQMGTWGSELEAEIVAHATGQRIHMWKPQQGLPRGAPKTYVRLAVFGPEDGVAVHVVNIIDNVHFAQFTPESDAWQAAGASTPRSGGSALDCGGNGDCLYHAILGERSTSDDIRRLRTRMVDYIMDHRDLYEPIASASVTLRWYDFLASRPQEAASVARRAKAFCARLLDAL